MPSSRNASRRPPNARARRRRERARAQPRHDERGAARRAPAPARQGAQVHDARPRAGRCAATPGFTCATPERDRRAWRAPVSAPTCCSRTRPSTPTGSRAMADSRRAGHGRGRLATRPIDAAAANGIREVLVDVNVGMPRCGCRPEDAGAIADLRARARPRRSAASWATRATSVGLADRSERDGARPRRDGRSSRPRTPRSAATSSPPAAPARTTSTRPRPRSRPARTR